MDEEAQQRDARGLMAEYLSQLQEAFGDRVWFCGLQGSRARRESAGSAPLDIVVILDDLSAADIATYRQVIEGIPVDKLACGFLAGKDALMSWEPAELFHFCNNTLPVIGTLDEVAALADEEAARRALWQGATGIYRGAVRNMVYEQSEDVLRTLYQSALAVMSALYFLRSGRYLAGASELSSVAEDGDAAILETIEALLGEDPVDFDVASGTLFEWARDVLLMFPDADSCSVE